MDRRKFIKNSGLLLISTGTLASVFGSSSVAHTFLKGGEKWISRETLPPVPAILDRLLFLTKEESVLVSAIFDRLIPADDLSISATDAGCVIFLDNQLNSDYGHGASRYNDGPHQSGSTSQGDQSPLTPQQIYRIGLAEMNQHCIDLFNRSFVELSDADKDRYLDAMEAGDYIYPSLSSTKLFAQYLSNVMEGFFADPIYGGNRNMVGWKMIGFPGARYDYRDVVEMKGEALNLQPVSIIGHITLMP